MLQNNIMEDNKMYNYIILFLSLLLLIEPSQHFEGDTLRITVLGSFGRQLSGSCYVE